MKALRRNRLVSLAAAIVAVLAALGTLVAHHRSVAALDEKNRAILAQERAFDAYNAYDAKQTRFTVYQAIVITGLVHDAAALERLKAVAAEEHRSSPASLERARLFSAQAKEAEEHAEALLRSYETVQAATTFFEIAIVLVSIATLTGSRYFLPTGCALSAIGLAIFAAGLLQGR
jgi:predicted cobalt transporter CbtA